MKNEIIRLNKNMTKEQKFYKALQDVFVGAKIEGEGGFINLMRIKGRVLFSNRKNTQRRHR